MDDSILNAHEVLTEARFANMTLPEMRSAYLEKEAATRVRLARAKDLEARKAALLERIANQLQSLQELIRVIPGAS
jgi:hypothetical protein